MCVRSGSNSGSLFVDLKFEELLRSMCVVLAGFSSDWECRVLVGLGVGADAARED